MRDRKRMLRRPASRMLAECIGIAAFVVALAPSFQAAAARNWGAIQLSQVAPLALTGGDCGRYLDRCLSALGAFRRALASDPTDPLTLRAIGLLESSSGQHDAAVSS